MNQPELTISLLGGLTIKRDGTVLSGFVSRKVEALFAYLACEPRPHPRETLATLLWPNNDQTRALANLSVALSSLRKQLDDYVLADRHTIGINTEAAFSLDVQQFKQALDEARARQQKSGKISRTVAAQLGQAVSLYKGDFLAGFNIRGTSEFEAWVLLEQERLRQMLLGALADLIDFHQERGHFSEGIRHAQQLLAIDPLQETAHRQLMTLYAQDDQRGAALAQYELCAGILDEELGVEPDEETTALARKIESGAFSAAVQIRTDGMAETARHNLPAAATTFIGRTAELARIDAWLATPNGRLLTIIGPGGIGKSRLAQEAARAHLGEFVDGVWHVSLVPHSDADGAMTAIAEAIGLTLSGKDEIATQSVTHLQSREMLLILDNMEHLLTPALLSFVTRLTRQAPEVRLIVTSRTRLQLQAESLLELRGLPYPESGEPGSVPAQQMNVYPAGQLFVDRVQRVQAYLSLDRQEAAVIQLCQLVDGMPLALELAATWTRVLSVAEIVAEIQRGLDALTTKLHDLPERHRNLHAVIASSWQMLRADEQALYWKLAVFRGGFTRPGAEQVAGASIQQLMSLVDHSFLRLDADRRFRRHPLLLQFAQEQLTARPEQQAQVQANHAHYFAAFVQSQEPALHGADAPAALAAIGADLENILAAWQWALVPMNEAILDKMVTGVGRFFADRSHFLEGTDLFENSLKTVRTQPRTPAREQIAAKIQVRLGRFWHETGRFAEAETALKEADTLARRHNLTETRITCLRQLGIVTDDQGKRTEARRYLEEAHRICHANGNTVELTPILNALGNLCVSTGDYDQARAYFDEAMAIAKSSGNRLRIAILYNNIGIIANHQKNYREAIRQWQLAQKGFKQLSHDVGLANTSHNIAMAHAGLEQYDEALANIQEAFATHKKIGHRRGMAGGLAVMGSIYHKLGKRRKARRYYYDALLLAHEVGATWVAIGVLVDVAEMEISYGEVPQATLLLTFAVEHPATDANTLAKAQALLAELAAEFSATVMADAKTAAHSHTLDSLIALLVGDRPL